MIVQTENSLYEVRFKGAHFEAVKFSHNPGYVIPGDSYFGNEISIGIGKPMVISKDGEIRLRTSPVVSMKDQ
jgi:hypothetical protein